MEVHRVKEFSFRPISSVVSEDDESDTEACSSKQECDGKLTRQARSRGKERSQSRHSVWNVDGEIIDEPAIHVRYGSCSIHDIKLKYCEGCSFSCPHRGMGLAIGRNKE